MRAAISGASTVCCTWGTILFLTPCNILFLNNRCGVNDVAKNYNDLGSGSYFEVDKCCRTHDHCPLKVRTHLLLENIDMYHNLNIYLRCMPLLQDTMLLIITRIPSELSFYKFVYFMKKKSLSAL